MIVLGLETKKPDQHSQRPSFGLNRPWRSTLKIQFQFGRVLFALAGPRLSGNVRQRMNQLITFMIFAALGCALWVGSNRLIRSGRVRAGKAVQSATIIVGVLALYAWHREVEKRTADSLSAVLLILEKRIQADDKRGSLEIVDRGIRDFGHPASLARSAESLRAFADSLPEKKKPRQASESTASSGRSSP